MQRTGHRSIDGIRVYKRTSEEQQKTVSAILHGDSTEGPSAQKQIKLTNTDAPIPITLNISSCDNFTINIAK